MVKAALANSAWLAASAPSWMSFRRAIEDPAREQEKLLRQYLKNGASSAFGREHGFREIKTYEQFTRRVPMRECDELNPWIERIKRGEQGVLTAAPVRRLVPTSGSTSAKKLVPYTDELHREFQRAIGPWIFDLYRRNPRVISGPSYWSVTPQAQSDAVEEPSAVPIGFDSDSEYLGGFFRRIVDAAMVVPPELNHITSIEVTRYVTLLLLLRRADLALISVWHPSFLELLLHGLRNNFDRLVKDLALGSCDVLGEIPVSIRQLVQSRPSATRAKQIEVAGPDDISALWPKLRIVSCWADCHAAPAAAAMSAALPRVKLQPKGLLATEGVVSIPFENAFPLAIRSHFFEFVDSGQRVVTACDLRVGETYEVVITTAGGLWRYRLDDYITVEGMCGQTPSVRFVGKSSLVSDRVGEKLSEGFVSSVLSRLFNAHPPPPTFSLLAPDLDARELRYSLYINASPADELAEALDRLLSENPNYSYCRKLGQLAAPRVFEVIDDAYSIYCERQRQIGQRLGDIKPLSLSRIDGWSRHFRATSKSFSFL